MLSEELKAKIESIFYLKSQQNIPIEQKLEQVFKVIEKELEAKEFITEQQTYRDVIAYIEKKL